MGDWRFWAPRTALAALLIATGDALALWLSPPLREFYPMWGPAQTSATELAKAIAPRLTTPITTTSTTDPGPIPTASVLPTPTS